MAEFFIDPEGGNDANNGTTFALRKKSLASLGSAAAAGDTIKVMASRDPVLLGNAQWTDNTNSIAIPAGLVKVIDDCNSITGWVASANMTVTAATTYRLPSASVLVTPGSSFTTGKAAYKPLAAPLDLSAFQVISVSVMMGTAAASGFWQLRLCSDALGDVPVVTIPITLRQGATFVNFNVAFYFPLQYDNGAALPNNINSISLFCPADPGTGSIRINNMIACKSYDDPQHLSLASIIGKNTGAEPEWYPIRYITESTVQLGNYAFASSIEGRPYRGVTENVPTYARLPCLYPWSSTERALGNSNGSASNYLNISGGWNRTDMSTQTGETFITGYGIAFPIMIDLGARNYIDVSKINPIAFGDTSASSPIIFSNPNGTRITYSHVVGCASVIPAVTSHKGPLEFNLGYVTNPQTNCDLTSTNGPPDYRITAKRITGGNASGFSGMRWVSGEPFDVKFDVERLDNFNVSGINAVLGKYVMKDTKFENNVQGDISLGGNAQVEIDNGQFLSATQFNASNSPLSTMRLTNINGDPTKNAYYIGHTAIFSSDTVVVDTDSTMSWKLVLTGSNWTSLYPLALPLMTFAFNANKLVTVTARVRRSDSACGAGIRIQASDYYGIPANLLDWGTGPVGAFETVELSFTPTKAGVMVLEALAYQDVANPTIYFDNFTVSQAD